MLRRLISLSLVLGLLVGCSEQALVPAYNPGGGSIETRPAVRTPSRPNTKRTATPCPTCVPCPTLPPEPTPTPTPSIGNRSIPIPFGDTFGFLQKDEKVFLLTLKESYRGEEAWTRILEANQFNEPPTEGMEYLLLYAHADYLPGVSDEALLLDEWDFRIISLNQILKPPSLVEPDPMFDLEFFPGASGGGWMAWHVFEEDEAPLLVFGMEYDGSGGVFFSTTP